MAAADEGGDPQNPHPRQPDLAAEARESYDRARTAAYDFQTGLLRSIREKPVKSMLYAAGVGFVIGAILSRSERR